jgi:DNA-binding Lrp family transcriptional regulator
MVCKADTYNSSLGYEDQIIDKLNKLTGIDPTRLDGAYDIIANVNAESTDKLEEIVRLHITKIDRIQSTLTLTVIEKENIKVNKQVSK